MAAVVAAGHTYLTIWEFWNGLDEILASKDEAYCRASTWPRRASKESSSPARRAPDETRQRKLAEAGYRDLLPSHALPGFLAPRPGSLVLDAEGLAAVRLCNFALIQKRKVTGHPARSRRPSADLGCGPGGGADRRFAGHGGSPHPCFEPPAKAKIPALHPDVLG